MFRRHISTHRTATILAIATAFAALGALALAPTGSASTTTGASVAQSALAAQHPTSAPVLLRTTSRIASTQWGFKALLWQKTIADPLAAYRLYYYNKCNPKRGVREFRYTTSWIYTTYQCWAILA